MKPTLGLLLFVGSCAPALTPHEVVAHTVDARCNVLARQSCDGESCDPQRAYTAPPVETRRGRVSYYADSLSGNRTASGDRYDPRDLTAASRDLPFGTIVRIKRRTDARMVIVRINDRGPSRRGGRLLDLSRAAAECLEMLRAGVIEVDAEILELGPRGRGH